MAEAKTEQEPSIEEILESIRQIISEDEDAPIEEGMTLQAEEEEPVADSGEPLKEPERVEDTAAGADLSVTETEDKPSGLTLKGADEEADANSDLTLKGGAPAADTEEDIVDLVDVVEEAPKAAEPEMDIDMIAEDTSQDEDLLSNVTADAATSAMAKLLATNVAIENNAPLRVGRVTLEDITKELLRPLVKSWLEQHLPGLIERLVAKEIEKLSRRALDK